jgi:hypothetical protein
MRKFPTAAEVEEMVARGYCASVIAEARELYARGQVAEELKAAIRKAFANVTLGNGIGLEEAQAIDDYATATVRAARRAKDERHDWAVLAAEDLDRYNSSLSFFDAEGMRFHLPAYMIAELEGRYGFDLASTIASSTTDDERYTLLDEAQRAAVRDFLRFVLDEPEYAFDRENIQLALTRYWEI